MDLEVFDVERDVVVVEVKLCVFESMELDYIFVFFELVVEFVVEVEDLIEWVRNFVEGISL